MSLVRNVRKDRLVEFCQNENLFVKNTSTMKGVDGKFNNDTNDKLKSSADYIIIVNLFKNERPDYFHREIKIT